jgi:hypothetical protein
MLFSELLDKIATRNFFFPMIYMILTADLLITESIPSGLQGKEDAHHHFCGEYQAVDIL